MPSEGIEPSATRLKVLRSTTELRRQKYRIVVGNPGKTQLSNPEIAPVEVEKSCVVDFTLTTFYTTFSKRPWIYTYIPKRHAGQTYPFNTVF